MIIRSSTRFFFVAVISVGGANPHRAFSAKNIGDVYFIPIIGMVLP